MLNYHSYETFSTQDWPGIRLIFFLQWCPFRCLYCQNPDTISTDANKQISGEEILEIANRERTFFGKKWWVTFSGGECLLQAKELLPVLKLLKENWINTCLDTNWYCLNDDVKEVLKYADTVMPDIKSMNPELHKKITWIDNKWPLEFIRYLDNEWKNYWIRYVLVPWLTDKEEDLEELWRFLASLKHFVRLDLLPYHTLALHKWEKLGWDYPLKDTPVANYTHTDKAKEILGKFVDINLIN